MGVAKGEVVPFAAGVEKNNRMSLLFRMLCCVIRRSAKNSNKRSGYSDFVYATENQ